MMTNRQFIPMSQPNIGNKEKDAIIKILKSKWLSEGPRTQQFEKQLGSFLNTGCVVVNNGSSALMASLIANGFQPGDKVLVPAFTFVATSSIPKLLGASIMVADVETDTFNISPDNIEKIVSKNKIKFVIIVDVGGLPADIDKIRRLSRKYSFVLIEDAAQSFGAEYKNKKLGSFDHLTTFSFQIAKQLTTIEGGTIATKNKPLIKKIRKIKDYGRTKKLYVHDTVGTNFRTTDLQAAMGIEQLKKVTEHIDRRNEIARRFKELGNFEYQSIPSYATRHSYMIFFLKADNLKTRNKCVKILNDNGIDARKSWLPIHMQPCNLELKNLKCPNAESVYEQVFTIPIFNNMTEKEVNRVVSVVRKL